METKRKYLCVALLWGFSLVLTYSPVLRAADSPDQNFWLNDLEEAKAWGKVKVGVASWYGRHFHGRKTASGESFNQFANTCASRTLPFGTLLRVTHLKNGKSAIVRVNDRGPYRKNRVLDLSYGVAKKLGIVKTGTGKVEYAVLQVPESSE